MKFYVGLHHPSAARHFDRCMVSINRLRDRKGPFAVGAWMLDSGAFTELSLYGHYRHDVDEYAAEIRRWQHCGTLVAAVSQDYMCEPFILAKTGLTVADHQRLTIERYDALYPRVSPRIGVLPVLQGYWPDEYLDHLRQYGDRLKEGQWVGVGSVCKRNADVEEIEQVLVTIHRARPDLRLHGFGLKLTALESSVVRDCLHSADSMAWSDAARKQARPLLMALREELGRKVQPREARQIYASQGIKMANANCWREAQDFVAKIEGQKVKQRSFQGRFF